MTVTGQTIAEEAAKAVETPGQDVILPDRQATQEHRRPGHPQGQPRAGWLRDQGRRARALHALAARRASSNAKRTPSRPSHPARSSAGDVRRHPQRRAEGRPRHARDAWRHRCARRRRAGRVGCPCSPTAASAAHTHGLMAGHVAPEAFVGGPIALVHEGDTISFDITARRSTLEVPEDELRRRKSCLERSRRHDTKGEFSQSTPAKLRAPPKARSPARPPVKLPFALQDSESVISFCRRHWMYLYPRIVLQVFVGALPVADPHACSSAGRPGLTRWDRPCRPHPRSPLGGLLVGAHLLRLVLATTTTSGSSPTSASSIRSSRTGSITAWPRPTSSTSRTSPSTERASCQRFFNYGDLRCQTAGEVPNFILAGIPQPAEVLGVVDAARDAARSARAKEPWKP